MNARSPEVKQFITERHRHTENGTLLPLPSREQINPSLLEIVDQIPAISGSWNPVEIYTVSPKDFSREKQMVFDAYLSETTYNPKFSYPFAEKLDLSAQREQLVELLQKTREIKSQINPDDRLNQIARKVIAFKLLDDIATCDLADGIKTKNEEKIALALRRKYPKTDEVVMNAAEELYTKVTQEGKPEPQFKSGIVTPEEYDWLKNKEFTPEEQKEAFEYVLQAYGMLKTDKNPFGYKVVIDEETTSLDLRDKSKDGPTLYIPAKQTIKMTGDFFIGTLAHEIEGHARQSMIGEQLFLIGGGPLKLDNEQLYEGYAIRMQMDSIRELFGLKESTLSHRFYSYPFAIQMAEQGKSFFEIFSDQVERQLRIAQKIPQPQKMPRQSEFDQKTMKEAMNEAWIVTYRAMRGHTDMTNSKVPFAMPKDLGYLRGFIIDKELNDNNFGYINESAVIAQGGLALLAQFDFSENDIPDKLKFRNITRKFWEEVLKPQITQNTNINS